MRNLIVLTSTLALFSVGAAGAQDLFQPSDSNSAPVHAQVGIDRVQTSGIETTARRADFSAAWDFGPSDQNDLPAPRFQRVR